MEFKFMHPPPTSKDGKHNATVFPDSLPRSTFSQSQTPNMCPPTMHIPGTRVPQLCPPVVSATSPVNQRLTSPSWEHPPSNETQVSSSRTSVTWSGPRFLQREPVSSTSNSSTPPRLPYQHQEHHFPNKNQLRAGESSNVREGSKFPQTQVFSLNVPPPVISPINYQRLPCPPPPIPPHCHGLLIENQSMNSPNFQLGSRCSKQLNVPFHPPNLPPPMFQSLSSSAACTVQGFPNSTQEQRFGSPMNSVYSSNSGNIPSQDRAQASNIPGPYIKDTQKTNINFPPNSGINNSSQYALQLDASQSPSMQYEKQTGILNEYSSYPLSSTEAAPDHYSMRYPNSQFVNKALSGMSTQVVNRNMPSASLSSSNPQLFFMREKSDQPPFQSTNTAMETQTSSDSNRNMLHSGMATEMQNKTHFDFQSSNHSSELNTGIFKQPPLTIGFNQSSYTMSPVMQQLSQPKDNSFANPLMNSRIQNNYFMQHVNAPEFVKQQSEMDSCSPIKSSLSLGVENAKPIPPTDHPESQLPHVTSTETQTRLADEAWVRNLVVNRKHSAPDIKHNFSNMKIFEVRQCLQTCSQLLQELNGLQEQMLIGKNTLDQITWQTLLDEVSNKKKQLCSCLSEVCDPLSLDELKKKLEKRRKKRQYQKRRRLLYKEEQENAYVRRQQLHSSIDAWLQDMQGSVEKAKREESLKKEADSVLSGVTRQKTEAHRQVALLSALQRLRDIRIKTASSRGESVSSDHSSRFNKVVDHLKELWEKQLRDCNLEEQGLRLMLSEAVDERDHSTVLREKRMLVLWEKLMFSTRKSHIPDFYVAAEKDEDSFISMRKSWDKLLSSVEAAMSTAIPVGWVLPTNPSSPQWEALLSEHLLIE